jgi:fructose-1,6-bisphosphatase/inositol monophosphatase family enzyme
MTTSTPIWRSSRNWRARARHPPPGCRRLDLAYVACGRFDGFWEFGLSPWDIAGGALLISEAGGLISDLAGNETYLQSGNLVAGNPKVFAQLSAGDRRPPDAGVEGVRA